MHNVSWFRLEKAHSSWNWHTRCNCSSAKVFTSKRSCGSRRTPILWTFQNYRCTVFRLKRLSNLQPLHFVNLQCFLSIQILTTWLGPSQDHHFIFCPVHLSRYHQLNHTPMVINDLNMTNGVICYQMTSSSSFM